MFFASNSVLWLDNKNWKLMSGLLKICQNGTCSPNIISVTVDKITFLLLILPQNPPFKLSIKLNPKIKQIFILQNRTEYCPIINQWGNGLLGLYHTSFHKSEQDEHYYATNCQQAAFWRVNKSCKINYHEETQNAFLRLDNPAFHVQKIYMYSVHYIIGYVMYKW